MDNKEILRVVNINIKEDSEIAGIQKDLSRLEERKKNCEHRLNLASTRMVEICNALKDEDIEMLRRIIIVDKDEAYYQIILDHHNKFSKIVKVSRLHISEIHRA